MTGLQLGDATGGFKCFRREVLEAIPLDQVRSNGYAFQIEMSFRAWKRGFRIAEIPIVFNDRTEGESQDVEADRPGGRLDGLAPPLVGHHRPLLSAVMHPTSFTTGDHPMQTRSVSEALRALTGAPFAKMTGSGNDFVVFNAADVDRELVTKPEVISAICNRHNGIGADGIVLLEAPAASGGHSDGRIRLRYYNRDGTLGELCGNATLCSTYWSVLSGLAAADRVALETDSGLVEARLRDGEPEIDLSPVHEVRVALTGLPLLDGEGPVGFAKVGVPHVVIVTPNLAAVDLVGRGRPIRQHPSLAPDGANVNWVSRACRWALGVSHVRARRGRRDARVRHGRHRLCDPADRMGTRIGARGAGDPLRADRPGTVPDRRVRAIGRAELACLAARRGACGLSGQRRRARLILRISWAVSTARRPFHQRP